MPRRVSSLVTPLRRHLALADTVRGSTLLVAGALLAVFVASVVIRTPWRGHLASGDQWVTGLTLRWVGAWHRDGAINTGLGLIDSPPTQEFAPPFRVRKWGLPGHALLVHLALAPLGLAPTVGRVMWVNLGIQLFLAIELAVLAYALTRLARPERPRLATLAAAHCGAFTLLFPPMLYWGQNLSCQDFSVLPLMVFVVAARWLRAEVGWRRGRILLDAGVAICVVLGTITEFLFWLLVPWLIVRRLVAERRGGPRTTDRWRLTLLLPFVATLFLLLRLFLLQRYGDFIVGRGAAWVVGGTGARGAAFVFLRLLLFGRFLRTYFADAMGPIGFVCLGLVVWKVLPKGRGAALPQALRGILIDLLVPCLLFTLALVNHQVFHTHSAMKYVPFIALTWTVLVPCLIAGRTTGRGVLAAAYAVVAVLAILPSSSGYADYFPAPQARWEREGAFLREHTAAGDTVVSTTADIDIDPPQRAALAERVVRRVYGPLDLLERVRSEPADAMVALYGPRRAYAAFGAKDTPAVAQGDLAITRFPVGRFTSFMEARPDAELRANLGEVLLGRLRPRVQDLHPYGGPIPGPPIPVALHLIDTKRFPLGGYDHLYWAGEERFHWKQFQQRLRQSTQRMVTVHAHELLVVGDARFARTWSLWERDAPHDDAPIEWARLVLGRFSTGVAKAGTRAWSWRGYDVVVAPLPDPPAILRELVPQVAEWAAYLVYRGRTPVGLAFGPTPDRPLPLGPPHWVAVVFDALAAPIVVPEEIAEPWTIRSGARVR